LIKIRKRERRERGQTLILVLVALPLFFALMALVVDGGNVLVHRRNIQVAADAAALAIAQNINPGPPLTCKNYTDQAGQVYTGDAACNALASDYASQNGVTSSFHPCSASPAPNCWGLPDDSHAEVRLQAPVATFFVGAVNALLDGGLSTTFNVSARAVAQNSPVLGPVTIPGSTSTGYTTTITGVTTDPDQLSGGSGVAFTMSRACNAITYGGNPKGQVVGAFATNGGLLFNGLGNAKHMFSLAYDSPRCPKPSADSGTSNCHATAWGDPPPDSNNVCVKNLLTFRAPITWPITPPSPPTPTSLAGTNPYPSDWYPSKCIDLGSSAGTFRDAQHPDHGPGVYCVSGPGNFNLTNLDLLAGDGYTFFALGGGRISVGSNGSKVKFYWPSACGAGTRPVTRASSYPCPGLSRTISGYDAFTLFYSTFTSDDGTTCAICLQGQSNNLIGDIFATSPNSFPPSLGPPAQIGGLVNVSGGGLAAGSGFIESWILTLDGNTGSYTGTGASIVIPGATHTTSETITVPDSVGDPTTTTAVVSTDLNLSE
jgi:putative Flp pilus-assembly TadE/G-like protein